MGCRKITFDVKKVKKDSLEALIISLISAGHGFKKLLNDEKKEKNSDKSIIDVLEKIYAGIQALSEEIETDKENPGIKGVIRRCKDILQLFKKIGLKRRALKTYYTAMDFFITANSQALYFKDADYILTVPSLKRLTVFLKDRFAGVVKRHFPYFRGATVMTDSDSKAVSVSFNVIAKGGDVRSFLDSFEPEVEKLLNWEMQKIGDGMYYEIHPISQGSLGMIYCEMDVEPIVYDPGG